MAPSVRTGLGTRGDWKRKQSAGQQQLPNPSSGFQEFKENETFLSGCKKL
jgi:hypothetical protein